jgi:hypothetical protein
MDAPHDQHLNELLELANKYPSPHNGQPMVLQPGSEGGLDLFFETARGLTATPISYLFSFVSIGVFVRHLELCAQALGHKLVVHLELPPQSAMGHAGMRLKCANIYIDYGVADVDEELKQAILRRQTSRKKYRAGLSPEEQDKTVRIVSEYRLQARFLDPKAAQRAIWLNQRAVFDDMFDPAVRTELRHWLRFSAAEKHAKRDGLAYDCMELSGGAMKFSINHYKMLHWPVIAPLMKRYYLRTMKDDSSVGYIAAPFRTEQQAYEIGRCIIDIWIELSRAGHYLHPFGTIVSNDAAHADFAKLVGLANEARDENYVVFIFRAGASVMPVKSERLSVAEHMYNTEQV